MASVFLIYNKNTEKNKESSNTSNTATAENFQNQGFPQDGNIPNGGFGGGPKGNFSRERNSTDSSEDRPELPDGNFKGEMPNGNFTGEKTDGEQAIN